MKHRPTDRELDRLLADLPRETASPDFSRRVLDDLGGPRRARSRPVWLIAAATAAAALVVGLWLVPKSAPPTLPPETLALQAEHRQLMEELAELKANLRASRAPAPVIYMGGDESLDLVLDLGPVWSGEAAGGALPAVYTGAQRPRVAVEQHRGDRR